MLGYGREECCIYKTLDWKVVITMGKPALDFGVRADMEMVNMKCTHIKMKEKSPLLR